MTFWIIVNSNNVIEFTLELLERTRTMTTSSRKAQPRDSSVTVNSLPPISPRLCSCDAHGGHFVDRQVQNIERFVHEEAKALGDGFHNSRKERFGVFKTAFDMLVDESTSFKPLLADINAEYLDVIKAVEKGEQQRTHISRDLKCVVGEKITKENYDKRIQDLERNAKIIKADNEQLRMKYQRMEVEMDMHSDVSKTTSNNRLFEKSTLLPGLKIEEQTDVNILSSSLKKLHTEVQTTQESMKTNFFPKEKKVLLEKDLQEKDRSHNHVSRYNKALKEKLGRLTIAVEVCDIFDLASINQQVTSNPNPPHLGNVKLHTDEQFFLDMFISLYVQSTFFSWHVLI